MPPKVSICVPTYNRKDYLRETLASIFRQTYRDYEIIVVDDGSTDDTEAMVRGLSRHIRYHWQPNSGDGATKNRLIDLAETPYVTLIDSDDLLVEDAVKRMMEAEEREPDEVIVYGPYVRIDEHGQIQGRCRRKLYSGAITTPLFQNTFVHSCGSLFPKEALQEAGKFDASLPVCSDIDLWLRLSLKHRFVALPEPTFMRRRHSGNLSTPSTRNMITQLEVLKRFYYQNGGANVIPRRIAMRRFCQEECRIARCALRQADFRLAKSFFRQSLSHRLSPKAALGLLQTRIRARGSS